MSIDKLKTKFAGGTWIKDVKHFFSKINEIIDYLNDNPIDAVNYKIYRAFLDQTGTNAPVATVLENTLGEISFSYSETGVYIITSDGLFTPNKSFIRPPSSIANGAAASNLEYYSAGIDNQNSGFIASYLINRVGVSTAANDLLYGNGYSLIEIKVYN